MFVTHKILQLLYMDSIDLGENNIPLGWLPRVRWYETQMLLDFTNLYEKCKGMLAKEAYLNRKVSKNVSSRFYRQRTLYMGFIKFVPAVRITL